MFDQFDYYKYLDKHPFTGMRNVDFDAKISTSEHISKFFNGTKNFEQVRNVTQGKVYHIFKVEGMGDVAEWYFINDIGQEDVLGDYFFVKPDEDE